MLDPITSVLNTRAGVLRYPDRAAEYLAANPPFGGGSSSFSSSQASGWDDPGEGLPYNNVTLGTRAGVLAYPDVAAFYIGYIQSLS